MKRKWSLLAASILLFFIIIFGPYFRVRSVFARGIHFQVSTLTQEKYGIELGAIVFQDHSLSAVTQERADAATLPYQNAIIEHVFVSADNRHNRESDAIASYLEEHGIPREDITIDRIGIDTGDTCRHFAEFPSDGLFLT